MLSVVLYREHMAPSLRSQHIQCERPIKVVDQLTARRLRRTVATRYQITYTRSVTILLLSYF